MTEPVKLDATALKVLGEIWNGPETSKLLSAVPGVWVSVIHQDSASHLIHTDTVLAPCVTEVVASAA